ncbi:hypothetical protein RYX36_033495 [Vicia faba]
MGIWCHWSLLCCCKFSSWYDEGTPSLNIKLKPLFDWLFEMSKELMPLNTALAHNPLNTALAQLGVIKPFFKQRHIPVPVEKRKEFMDLVEQIGRDNFVGEKDVQVLDDRDFLPY